LSGGHLDCARYHILAIRPWLEIKGYGRNISFTAGGQTVWMDEDPFEALRLVVNEYAICINEKTLPVAAGLFGYLSYDLKDFIEELPRTSVNDLGLPQFCLFAPSAVIVHDKVKNHTRLCVTHRVDHNYKDIGDDLDTIAALLNRQAAENMNFAGGTAGLNSSFSQSAYMDAVKRLRNILLPAIFIR